MSGGYTWSTVTGYLPNGTPGGNGTYKSAVVTPYWEHGLTPRWTVGITHVSSGS